MGLTISWEWQGPETRKESESILESMRKRALDLPLESVSEIVCFAGENAQYDRSDANDEFRWLKLQASRTFWNEDRTDHWDCPATEVVGFEIYVAPGSESMSVFLATYPDTIQITDKPTGQSKRLETMLHGWSGSGFCKTQYASDPKHGGIANFLRAHLSICRMLDCAMELGLQVNVLDDGKFFGDRDIPRLVQSVGEWNQQIAAFVGAFTDQFGKDVHAPIRGFSNFEHLEVKGHDQIDAFLQILKRDDQERRSR